MAQQKKIIIAFGSSSNRFGTGSFQPVAIKDQVESYKKRQSASMKSIKGNGKSKQLPDIHPPSKQPAMGTALFQFSYTPSPELFKTYAQRRILMEQSIKRSERICKLAGTVGINYSITLQQCPQTGLLQRTVQHQLTKTLAEINYSSTNTDKKLNQTHQLSDCSDFGLNGLEKCGSTCTINSSKQLVSHQEANEQQFSAVQKVEGDYLICDEQDYLKEFEELERMAYGEGGFRGQSNN